jgi:hypothetical protein
MAAVVSCTGFDRAMCACVSDSDIRALVADNEETKAINRAVFDEYLRSHPVDLRTVNDPNSWRRRGALRVLATVQGAAKPVVDYVRALSLKRLGQRPGELDLLLGGELLILQNQHVRSGIVNGTIAVLHDIVLKPDATVTFAAASDSTGYGIHTVEASDVVALLLRHTTRELQSRAVFPTLPAGFFPLIPKVGACLGPGKDDRLREQTFAYGGRVGLKPKVTQFECIPAYSLTCHKYQGQTANAVLLAGFGHGPRVQSTGRAEANRCGTKGWLYVALSRVRTLDSLFLLSPIQTDAEKYVRRFDVIAEMDRLRQQVFGPTTLRLRRALALEQKDDGEPPVELSAGIDDSDAKVQESAMIVPTLSAREQKTLAILKKRLRQRQQRRAAAAAATSNAVAVAAPLRTGLVVSRVPTSSRPPRQFVRARRRVARS